MVSYSRKVGIGIAPVMALRNHVGDSLRRVFTSNEKFSLVYFLEVSGI